ncbi:MAG TPA: tetratricopeptide repeat protein, partial [Chitinophagaceae bacterium]
MKTFLLSVLIFSLANCFAQRTTRTIDSLKELLTISKEDTNKVWLLNSLSRKYLFYDPDSAVQYAHEGLSLAKELNFEKTLTESELFWSLSFAYSILGDYPNALKYWSQCIKVSTEIHSMDQLTWAYAILCDSYRDQGNYPEALKNIEMARSFSLGNPSDNMYCDRMKASVLEQANQLDSALIYLNRAFPL